MTGDTTRGYVPASGHRFITIDLGGGSIRVSLIPAADNWTCGEEDCIRFQKQSHGGHLVMGPDIPISKLGSVLALVFELVARPGRVAAPSPAPAEVHRRKRIRMTHAAVRAKASIILPNGRYLTEDQAKEEDRYNRRLDAREKRRIAAQR